MTCDEVFYRQYLSGDDAGLEALMKKYGDPLTLYIDGYLHDVHEAEELMLDVFAYLFTKKPKIRDGGFKAYPWYTEDAFIEVSDEVAAFLEEDKRLQINYAQYIRDNRAFYSLDAGDGIEADALNLPEQPDEALERMELERLLKEAMAQLTPAQRRRVLAHFVEGRSQLEIAASEGVVKSTVSEAISRGRKKLRNFLKKFR